MAYVKSIYDLDVFRLAYDMSLELHKLSKQFDKTEQYGGIADQIRRSSKSICANIVEGFGKNTSIAEFKRFISIAQGSAKETELWLKYAFDLNYLNREDYLKFTGDYERVLKMLSKLKDSRDS